MSSGKYLTLSAESYAKLSYDSIMSPPPSPGGRRIVFGSFSGGGVVVVIVCVISCERNNF